MNQRRGPSLSAPQRGVPRLRQTGRSVAGLLLLSALFCTVTATAAEPWRRHTIDDSSRGADGVRLADVNADGHLDIATGWEEGGVIRAYLNPGPKRARTRWPQVTVGKVRSAEDAVFADLDGDGVADVVSCCEGRTKTVFVHWAPTKRADYLDPARWKTDALPVTAGQQSWMFALPLDVDGKHGLDLVVGSKGGGASIGWLEAPADPRQVSAWKFHRLYDAGWIMSLLPADMDGDGDLDVLASDRKGPSRGALWLENPGPQAAATGARWRAHRVGPLDRETMFLGYGDLDADGGRDVIYAVRGAGFTFLRADKAGGWQEQQIPMPSGCGTGKAVAVGDIDRDGRPDLVFSCENARSGASGMRWLSPQGNVSTGKSTWTDHEISGPQGVKFDRIELVDLDGDDDLDVLCCEERDQLGVFWYENPTLPRQ